MCLLSSAYFINFREKLCFALHKSTTFTLYFGTFFRHCDNDHLKTSRLLSSSYWEHCSRTWRNLWERIILSSFSCYFSSIEDSVVVWRICHYCFSSEVFCKDLFSSAVFLKTWTFCPPWWKVPVLLTAEVAKSNSHITVNLDLTWLL